MTACPPHSQRPGLHGHLRLVCALDANGRSHLQEQSFSVPFHLSKPFHDNGALVVNVVNPTAGLFRGDTTRSEVCVEEGARLLLTNPSATRVHDTQDGASESVQDFRVRPKGWLEILPELFIPQQGARHRQRTSIEVDSGGELLYLEMLAPGRVASGEIFAFEELDWRTEIRSAGKLIARERFLLSPRNGSLRPLLQFSRHPYLATFFVISERLRPDSACWNSIGEMHAAELWIGSSQLVGAGWVIKMIAADSTMLREAVAAVRQFLYQAAKWPRPELRKL